jgi:hypothetical protein
VDSTTRFEYLSSLNANSGYHQILVHPDDEEKTTFISREGTFCYKVLHACEYRSGKLSDPPPLGLATCQA